MAQPTTLSGMRDAGARGKVEARRGLPDIPDHVRNPVEGERVFVSPNEGLRMTLWVNWDKVTYTSTGKRQPERRDIQFRGGIYRTRDEKEIEALLSSRSKGVTFYALAELQRLSKDAKIKQAMDVLKDPDVVEALRASKDKTIALPPRGKKQTPEAVSEDAQPQAAS